MTIVVATLCGFSLDAARQAVSTFKAVTRRQELRYDKNGVMLIEDFAHHPTAVHETLSGLREAFPAKRIWAVFEPRSNTSRRKVFQEAYIQAFQSADQAILSDVEARSIDAGHDLIDVPTLCDQIAERGVPAVCLSDAKAIQEHILQNLGRNDLIVLMSNGAFGGLPASLEAALREKVGA